MARSRFTLDRAAIARLQTDPDGAVGLQLRRIAEKVRTEAVLELTSGPNRARDTGTLAASLNVEPRREAGRFVMLVGSRLAYARYVHDGTGIYGPKGRPITPRRGRVLRWPVVNNAYRTTGGPRRYRRGQTAQFAYARSVKGMRPRPFLLAALRRVLPSG